MSAPKWSDPWSRPQHAARRSSMFTIDSENNIAAHTGSRPAPKTMTSTTLTITGGGSMTMPELQVYGASTVDVFTGATLTTSTSASFGTGATLMIESGSSASLGALGVGSQNSAPGVATVVAEGTGSTLKASLIQVSGGGVV